MSNTNQWSGGCMCGAIRFDTGSEVLWVGICHCSSCRRATGGALVTAVGFPRIHMSFSGKKPSTYMSSPGVLRSFCSKCGTSIAYQSEQWPEDIHMMVGAFDEPERLVPEFHIFTENRLHWICISDALPQFKTTPSAGDLISG
jgi:hypothetical protein